MFVGKNPLKLQPDEDQLLRHRYLAWKIPSDQFTRRPAELRAFMSEWNALADRQDSSGDLLHYIKTKRKRGKWVTFDGNHERQPILPLPLLTESQWVAFDAVYKGIGKASDNYVYDAKLPKIFAATFAGQTGTALSTRDIIILMIDRRKEGLLPQLEDGPDDHGFTDIDDVTV